MKKTHNVVRGASTLGSIHRTDKGWRLCFSGVCHTYPTLAGAKVFCALMGASLTKA